MQGFLKNSALVFAACLTGLILLEGVSRFVYPIQYGHKYFSADGREAVEPANKDEITLKPSLTYRQKTQEFDKITTHTARGFRGPKGGFMDPAKPDVIFIGDSMTYGIGLSDEETIPYLYCQGLKLHCVNLGRPSTSTQDQLDILEHYLTTYAWRPVKVNLIMNAMTSSQF